MKNLVLNLRNAKAQAGCAKSGNRSHSSLPFREGVGLGFFMRGILLTLLFLTLGVGQMWGLDLYLDISACTGWTNDGATIKLWPGTGSDVTGTSIATNLYKFTVSSAKGTMYFKRMSGSSTWNQASVAYSASANLYKLTGWDAAACSGANINTVTKNNYIYFVNNIGWENANKYFVIGHDQPTAYSKVYSMSPIEHTQLLYVANTADNWTDATYYGFCATDNSWGNGAWGSSNLSNASKYTGTIKTKKDLASSKYYLFDTNGNASDGASLIMSDAQTSYSATKFNTNLYAYRKVLATGETNFANSSSNSVGTVSISGYAWSGRNSTSSTSANIGDNTSANITTAITSEITLTAVPGAGYTFAGWYTSAPTTLAASTPVSTDLTYTYNIGINSGYNIHAGFIQETSHDVTIQEYCSTTSTPISSSTRAIGELTYATVTAPEIYGYTFDYWTKGTGIDLKAGDELTSSTIHVKTKASGAYVLTARYTEDLSSPWVLKGGTNITGDNWATEHAMTKKTGHSTENVAYYTANISSTNSGTSGSADAWSFKLIKNSSWYGLTASGSYWWSRSTSANQSLTTSGANIQICADVAGTYEIKVDYSTATPKITVTFPTKYTVTYSVSPSGAANAITTSPSVASGGSVAAGTSMTFTHAAAKTGYSWYRWENGSGSSLGTGSTYTTTINANTTVVAKYRENTFNVTATASAGGSATPTSATSMGQITGGNITATPNTGYNFVNWTITSGSGYFGTSGTATTSTTASTKFRPTAAATIRANFTPKQTTITLNNQDATTPGTTEVTATYDAAMPAITLPTKTGYTFGGYWGAPGGSGPQYYNADGSSAQNWENENSTYTLFAKWTPKQSAISFDYQLSTEGHGNAGTLSSVTATYDAAMPALTGNMPTAAEGYAFMGFFSETGGNGTKYYNPDKTSAHNWDVNTESATTLYAYYKKAEITGITFSPAAAEPGDEVTATADISPTPSGTTTVCWEVRYASNDIPLSPQPTLTPASGASVTFTAPPAAVYKFIATLKTGNDCSGGTILDTENANLTVAGSHPVTIRYKHGDVVIKEETIQNIHATVATEISAPNIIGYSFSSWTLGDGITKVSGNLTDPSITVTAIYDGVITANYNPKRMIYFYNTLSWSSVNVYFYKNDSYWNSTNGTGADQTYTFTNTPYSEGKHGTMTRIDGTNIWYFDAEAAGVNASYTNVVFTELNQHGYGYFAKTDDTPNKVVRRGDYHSTMPMFVPVEQDGVSMNGGRAIYYNEGYWMNYPENTGYTVRIYNAWNADKTSPAREYYFPYSSDKKMPLKLDVEFNTTDAKWFMIYRNDGAYLSVNAEMTQASHTNYRIKDSNDKIKIQPSAPGIYTYTLTFYDDGEKDGSGKAYGNMYHITVDYPVSVGDYRILYKDNATWSQGTAHTASWCHPSDAVNKISGEATEAKKDTVSLFVSYGASPTAKFQYVSAINPSTGAVTWTDVAGGTINLSSITKSGTYNFIISQPVGGASVSVEKIEAYTGNYYIRTDCAGNTKWDSYRAADHQMTYSEFSCSDANSFGEKFSHYFTHWCPAGMNVKFVIANDYSSCISDTLIQDVGNTYANINSDGFLNSDGSAEETANRFSANIRFMYHEATNKISRAYVASSTNSARWFLVLRSNSAIHGQDDDPIEDIGSGKPSVILDDKQNWIYEQTLRILPGSKFKLFACYADVTPTEARAQYFRGNYASNDWSNSANTIELVGGTGDYQKVRVLYDFKTNRLVCAWLPDGDVSGDMDINADVMIIREHQEDATLITFATSSSKLTDVKTVYGTMKFNRWTLNNKSSSAGHAVLPVDDQKSIFERSLYFISFPFDVNLGEVFGFGTYGVHWIIENYDGETRAKNGYWTDSPPNWKYVMSPKGYTLKANKGYILALDLDLMKDDNEVFWPHGIETVELFFPSAVAQSTIEQENVTIPAPDPAIYQCTINRPGPDGDRRIKDSYWRCLGVPSFANYTTTLSDGTSTITWQTGSTLPYLYAWNMENNKLVAQSTSTFAFKTMHAYLTQCSTAIVWSAASKPTPIAARYSDNEMLKDREFRLELAENDIVADQAFVRLSAKEDVSAEFEFGNDLSKELNSGASNIYTLIGYERAAANSLPLSTEQTTIIPVGVLANTVGDYTFSIPDGTDGIGITLVDSETGIRTQLGALDYTVTLDKGTYDERFYLEISPIHNTPTDLGGVNSNQPSAVRKVIIDQNMYIIRDGKMYDARGARCN